MNENRVYLHAVTLLAVTVAVYSGAISGDFHYDDFHSIVLNPHVRDLANIPAYFVDPSLFSVDPEKGMYRPLLLVSYSFNYAWGEYAAEGYLWVNLLTHITCVFLIWGLGARFGLSEEGRWIAALLFALHPLGSESVNYISSRSESLAAAFVLGALFCYAGKGRLGEVALSLVLFACALMVKSIAIVLPAVLLLYDVLWCRRPVQLLRYVPYGIIAVLYLLWISLNGFLGGSLQKSPHGFGIQLWTQSKALIYYAKLLAMPVSLNVEHQFNISHSLAQGVVVFAFLTLIVGVAFAVKYWKKRGVFFFAWALLALLPTLIVPLNVLVNEHRLYVPLAALALAVGHIWERSLSQLNTRRALYAVFVVYGLLTFERNDAWSDEKTLWSDSVAKSPEMPRPHVYLGNALRDEGNVAAAHKAYERVLVLDPGHRSARTNLANLYVEAVQRDSSRSQAYLEKAEQHYLQVLASDDSYREALNNLGSVYMMRGELGKAERMLKLSAEAHPNYVDAYYNLALLKVEQIDYKAAVGYYEAALGLAPNGQIHYELGNALARLNEFAAAAASYRRALEFDPGDLRSRYNLAEVLLVAGENARAEGNGEGGLSMWREAQGALQDVLRADPGHSRASARLSQLRERMP